MTKSGAEIIVMGGSAGSISVMNRIFSALPGDLSIPVVVVLHRMKNVRSDLKRTLATPGRITEPEDKEPVKAGHIYLAPQNYHLLVEQERIFSMDYSELVNYSRPSIDVTFVSVAEVYRDKVIGILLSGANHDGAEGLDHILLSGGRAIVQDPKTAEYPTMPEAAIQKNNKTEIMNAEQITDLLLSFLRT